MKRYTVACEDCGCAVDDDVVPASVAQALYDALQKVAQRLDANDCDEWTLYALKTTAFEALSLADGEEQL